MLLLDTLRARRWTRATTTLYAAPRPVLDAVIDRAVSLDLPEGAVLRDDLTTADWVDLAPAHHLAAEDVHAVFLAVLDAYTATGLSPRRWPELLDAAADGQHLGVLARTAAAQVPVSNGAVSSLDDALAD